MSPLTGVVIVILILVLAGTRAAAARRALHTLRIERKLDVLLQDAGRLDSIFPPVSARVQSLISSGERVDAIRAYRTDNPAVALKDANEVVSAIMSPGSPRRPDLGRLEIKVDALVNARGLDETTRIAVSGAARESVAAGRLVDAVRVLRADNPGLSLTEARVIARGLR